MMNYCEQKAVVKAEAYEEEIHLRAVDAPAETLWEVKAADAKGTWDFAKFVYRVAPFPYRKWTREEAFGQGVMRKGGYRVRMIIQADEQTAVLSGKGEFTYDEILEYFVQADGTTPAGVYVEPTDVKKA